MDNANDYCWKCDDQKDDGLKNNVQKDEAPKACLTLHYTSGAVKYRSKKDCDGLRPATHIVRHVNDSKLIQRVPKDLTYSEYKQVQRAEKLAEFIYKQQMQIEALVEAQSHELCGLKWPDDRDRIAELQEGHCRDIAKMQRSHKEALAEYKTKLNVIYN